MSSNITLFQSDSSSATTGNAFDQDAFQDISLPPTNNTSLTDTASTNPLGTYFANDDSVRLGAKTLYIKDLVLLSDHTKWISGKPTYQIIWNENYPWVSGYIFGNIQITQGQYVSVRQIGDGIGVTGVFRKCAFLITGDTSATATAQLAVDGANTTTIDFSNLSNPLNDENGNILTDKKYNAFVNAAANQTKDIHDYRLTALQTGTLRLVGIVVYAENSGANIDIFPGSTYNNKNKITSGFGATIALPSFSGSLGGKSLAYKGQNGSYNLASLGAPNIASVATGSTGTNLVNVTTGTGASFPIGSGIAAFWGATGYLGSVTNQSTDTLTVSPTLSFGISGVIYKSWSAGQSLAINSSQLILSKTIDFSQYAGVYGFTNFGSDPENSWRVWGNGFTISPTDTIWTSLNGANTSLGFIQVEGYFSGADIEMVGSGTFHATLHVNGFPAWGINSGQTGSVKKTIFNDAGPGWNNFNLSWGASYSGIGINRINLYRSAMPQNQSFGLLASFDTLPNYVSNINSANATNLSLGIYKRYFADEIFMQGGWQRGSTVTAAGGINYLGASTNAVLNFQWYGKNYGVIGTNNGQSMTVSLDGAAVTGITMNVMNTVASEGWHSIVLACKSVSGSIQAIDVARTHGEVDCLQNQTAFPSPKIRFKVPTVQKLLSGSGTYVTPSDAKYIRVRLVGGGGGGGGGGGSAGSGGAGGSTSLGTILTAGGGAGGPAAGAGSATAGGTVAVGPPAVQIAAIVGATGTANVLNGAGITPAGSYGGSSPFGGAGGGNAGTAASADAAVNSGSGGGAGGANSGASGGGAGAAGGYIEALLPPQSAIAFSIGAGGAAGSAGSGGGAGGAGGSGQIIVEEYY